MKKRIFSFLIAILLLFSFIPNVLNINLVNYVYANEKIEENIIEDNKNEETPGIEDDEVDSIERPVNYIDPEQIFVDSSFTLEDVDSASLAYWGTNVINIEDPVLENQIRIMSGLSKYDDITIQNMLDLPSTLNFAGLGISNLEGIQYALNTTSLTLANNSISDVSNLQYLYKLRELDLSMNELDAFPSYIYNFKNLEVLILDNNKIKYVSAPEKTSYIKEFSINSNKLTELPDFNYLSNLTSFSAMMNSIETVPDNISNLTKLTYLNLSSNKIMSMPSVTLMTKLVELDLSDNELSVVPEGVETLSKLTTLVLSQNNLYSFPEVTSGMVSLETLDLGHNDLKIIPSGLDKLENLKNLYIRLNQIDISKFSAGIDILKEKCEVFEYELQKPIFSVTWDKSKKTLNWGTLSSVANQEGSVAINKITVERRLYSEDSNYEQIAELDKSAIEYIDEDYKKKDDYFYRVSVHCTATTKEGVQTEETSTIEIATTDEEIATPKDNKISWQLITLIVILGLIILVAGAGSWYYFYNKKNTIPGSRLALRKKHPLSKEQKEEIKRLKKEEKRKKKLKKKEEKGKLKLIDDKKEE